MPTIPITLKAVPMPVACFAPPLTEALLSRYREVVGQYAGPREIAEALKQLLACVELWWSLPESKVTPETERMIVHHQGQPLRVPLIKLEESHIAALWEVTPWIRELSTLSMPAGDGLFDYLEGDLRTAAFHLLWYCKELTHDREPLTNELLKG